MTEMVEQVPEQYFCPITMDIMIDPVVLCEDVNTMLTLLNVLRFVS
jgi:hypothetical protein